MRGCEQLGLWINQRTRGRETLLETSRRSPRWEKNRRSSPKFEANGRECIQSSSLNEKREYFGAKTLGVSFEFWFLPFRLRKQSDKSMRLWKPKNPNWLSLNESSFSMLRLRLNELGLVAMSLNGKQIWLSEGKQPSSASSWAETSRGKRRNWRFGLIARENRNNQVN